MSFPFRDLVEFGRCRYSFKTRTLFRDGCAVSLQPRATDVLEFLITNRDRIVSRKDLIDEVWKARVEEGAIDYQIAAIRRALGPLPGNEPYIKNKSGHGWHFAVEVRDVLSPQIETPSVEQVGSYTGGVPGMGTATAPAIADSAPDSGNKSVAPVAQP